MNESASSGASMASPECSTAEDGQSVAMPPPDAREVVTSAEDMALVQALRAGDEAAFAMLVERYNGALLRVARMYVHDRAVAEEVVQDTWVGVLNGIDRFEPRASLKTWIFRILMNRARTSAKREGRSIPFSAAWESSSEPDEPVVDPDRFQVVDAPDKAAGWWVSPPRDWVMSPERALLAAETRAYVAEAIAALPPQQREVITLRDVEGWSSAEVRNVLNISEINERVLLHRARSKVRQALERYFTQER
ncbi:MAG: RNA polymerase sigma factor [Ktedonobacterales bacterium]